MFIVKFDVLKMFLISSEVTDLVIKIKISICICPTMDQKLHIDVLSLRLIAATTNNVAIINTSINIPSAFASSDGPD